MNRFCDLLSELGDRCLRGSPPQSKADKEQAEKLTNIHRRMPASLQLLLAETAQECSCGEQVTALIGPLQDGARLH